jgi:hypothetical protein
MATARIDEFTVLVRYYEADYSPTEIKEVVEATNLQLANELIEGNGVLVQVKPKEEGQ